MTAQTAKQKAAAAAKDANSTNSKVTTESKMEVYLSKTVQLMPGAEPLKPGSHLLIESVAKGLIEGGLAVSKESANSEEDGEE
ncbi:hypothetical protein [Alteromonas phage P24]|nr:hypothetical protein [Alteromonas phage P24]MEC8233169.1 hypothetical protein [Pseudomonadota bacterium]